jgi:iron complex transport system substrate-binding protein
MRRLKVWLLLVLMVIIVVGAGCNQKNENTAVKEKIVVDAIGNTVKVPDKVTKTIIGCQLVPQEVSVLGGSDTVIAMLSQDHTKQLYKMFPRYKDVPDIGSFEQINIEELLKMNPDVYFGGRSAPEANEKLLGLGVNVYTSYIGWATVDTIKDEFRNIAAFYGSEKEAEELIQYWNTKQKMLADMQSNIPGGKKKTVYYMNSKNPLQTHNKDVWAHQLITSAGGINVAADLVGNEVNIEQLLEWDPDVIFVNKDYSRPNIVEEIKGDPRFHNMKALKNNELYVCPIGSTWWYIPSPEAPLGFMWLAKILYPDLTQDINLEKETKYFYKNFYKYDLSDEEYKSFF